MMKAVTTATKAYFSMQEGAAAGGGGRGVGVTCCPLDATITTYNKLITKYYKAGNLASAQQVFDQMPLRDVVSWNSLMSAYAVHQKHDEVLHIFAQMRSHGGMMPTHTSISIALSACSECRDFLQGKQIHSLLLKMCSSSNVFVGTSLITMYAKSGIWDCLNQVFEEIECPTIVSWNALLSGLLLNLRITDARKVFDTMPSHNVVSWTAMIHGYAEINKVNIALQLFDAMPVKNLVTWSVILGGLVSNGKCEDAIELFVTMINQGVRAARASLVEVVNASANLGNIEQGRILHGYAIKVGLHLHEIIEASLVSMYCKSLSLEEAKLEFKKMEIKHVGSCNSLLSGLISWGKIDDARGFFDCMEEKDKISWNIIVSGYLKCNRIDDALEIYAKMPEPTTEATSALMSSFIRDGRLHEAEMLFDFMLEKDVIAGRTMLNGYLKHGLLQKAFELFDTMPDCSVVTYNIMISGLLKHGKVNEVYDIFSKCSNKNRSTWEALITGIVYNGLFVDAFMLFKEMLLAGLSPSDFIISSLLSASSRLSMLLVGQQIHPFVIKLGHSSCLVVANSLISMYCRFGDLTIARSVFDEMTDRDVVTWNTLIYGCGLNGFSENAIQLFEEMRTKKTKPDQVTFLAVLSACAHACLLEKAQHYFNLMRYEIGITPDLGHYTVMVDLMSKMGMVKEAERLIHAMPVKPDPVMWTSLLSGCRSSSNVKSAENAFDQIFILDPKNPLPFSHLLSVYVSSNRCNELGNLHAFADTLQSQKEHGCSWI